MHTSLVCPVCCSEETQLVMNGSYVSAELISPEDNPKRIFACSECDCYWEVEYFPAKKKILHDMAVSA